MPTYRLYRCRGKKGRCSSKKHHFHVLVGSIIQFHVPFFTKDDLKEVVRKLMLPADTENVLVLALKDWEQKKKRKELIVKRVRVRNQKEQGSRIVKPRYGKKGLSVGQLQKIS